MYSNNKNARQRLGQTLHEFVKIPDAVDFGKQILHLHELITVPLHGIDTSWIHAADTTKQVIAHRLHVRPSHRQNI